MKQMFSGAETPSTNRVLLGALPAKGGAKSAEQAQPLPTDDLTAETAQKPDTATAVAALGQSEKTSIAPDNFRQVIEEFQERLTDDSRIPPSIFNQMRFLLEESLKESQPPNFDKTA